MYWCHALWGEARGGIDSTISVVCTRSSHNQPLLLFLIRYYQISWRGWICSWLRRTLALRTHRWDSVNFVVPPQRARGITGNVNNSTQALLSTKYVVFSCRRDATKWVKKVLKQQIFWRRCKKEFFHSLWQRFYTKMWFRIDSLVIPGISNQKNTALKGIKKVSIAKHWLDLFSSCWKSFKREHILFNLLELKKREMLSDFSDLRQNWLIDSYKRKFLKIGLWNLRKLDT